MPVVVDRQKPLLARVARNLAPGPYGIPEPGPEVPEVPLGSIDLVVVPGLAFDRRGARLGQGGGYYDRTLCQTGALRVAVAYSEQVVERLHTEAHDLPMNILVTEAEVFRF
jgi:5-formyltetrahydrofolate cyclo-ligase